MLLRSETPPSPGNLQADPPPDSNNPTSAQLKGDIDSGRTGDKIPHVDVGAAPLGTCEEAGGAPPTSQEVRLARQNERAPSEKAAAGIMQTRTPWITPAFAGAIVAIAVVLTVSLWLTH
ncbi:MULTISPECIES: hypothetical protein [unclassified Methylobacterium]|jgi:hypothetical protein|uniref:hypothetical protein n=1 Tax=unclassified Methylobacterium TaxID=2615210 RepID=UPI0011C1FD55|nr:MULTISPECIES: hypothetical protein [unclassified Methylobacterium]QEE41045.1 hypothetical protein FVA80_20780 [Methylobacterium sp. WL1]TXN00534.1 hypothetical protein FV242_21705 [Methylobacterium sp. WL64]TXN58892.1 hypothetical protein FV241_04775 [Methylobacterium sp. WL2]